VYRDECNIVEVGTIKKQIGLDASGKIEMNLSVE